MKLSKKYTIIFFILATLTIFSFLYYKEGTMPVNKSDKSSKIFIINPGDSLNIIARKLKTEDLIRNPVIFYIVVKQKGIDKKIQAGDFRLSPSMTVEEIADNLTHGTLDVWVTIIEGLRKEEIAQIISKKIDVPEVEFIKQAPEGYLFPDTYLIPKQATSGSVIKILTNTFDNRFNNELKAKIEDLKISEHEAITLASIVEREARNDQDRQTVASILLKRLQNDLPLQVDATVQYALGYQTDEKTWWKTNLTFEDLKIKSAYNTYENIGLPPEPICNPSLSSINAVANADPTTPYLFYLTDRKGKMYYGKNLEEHNRNIELYLNK